MNKKLNKKVFVLAIVFIVLVAAVFSLKNGILDRLSNAPGAKAAATDNVAGFAWSENIGWISFNSTNCDIDGDGTYEGAGETGGPAPAGCPVAGTVAPYGVYADIDGTNNLNGYVWSEHIGWISFKDTDVVGCPFGFCQPRYDSGTGELRGWAKALNAGGGWDGWISLNCVNMDVCGASNYKITKSGDEFTGFAWGGDVVGWISFNSKNCDTDNNGTSNGGAGCPAAGTLMSSYKVYLADIVPVAANLTVTSHTSNAEMCAGPWYEFSWNFVDPGDGQSSYDLQVSTNSAFTALEVDMTIPVPPNPNKAIVSLANPAGADQLAYGKTYYWRVQVWDDHTPPQTSGWVNYNDPSDSDGNGFPDSFTTPNHPYPSIGFNPPTPYLFLADEVITFKTDYPGNYPDSSICYNNTGVINSVACSNWVWNFGDGTGDQPAAAPGNIDHVFAEPAEYKITLTATDADGHSCSNNPDDKKVKALQPKWKEVTPLN